MKRFLAIPAIALAAVALTGCDDDHTGLGGGGGGGGYTWTGDRLVEIVERPNDGSPSITTRLEWGKQGAQTKETQTVSGQIVYEDEFLPASMTNARIRTLYNADGTIDKKQQVESSMVTIQGYTLEKSYAVYNLDDSGVVIRPAAEQQEYEYDTVGNPIMFKRLIDGVLVKYQYEFSYDYDQARFWQQNSEDSADRQRMYHVSTVKNNSFDGGYRLYIGEPLNGGIKIEEKIVIDRGDFFQSYTIIRWDPETGEKIYDSNFALQLQEMTFTL